MEPLQIIGQIIGFIAIAISFASFQARRRSSILIIQALANTVWGIHFLMIGSSPSGYIINFFCVFRNILYSGKDRFMVLNKKIVPICVAMASTALSVIFANTPLDYLLIPSTIVSSFAFYLSDEKKIRAFSIFVSCSWIIYNFINFSISGTIAELFNLTSIIISMIRYSKIKAHLYNAKPVSAENLSELQEDISPEEALTLE